jgi:hypothetical protein
MIVSFSWRLELEAWRLELAALAAGRLFLFNFRLCRNRIAAAPVFQCLTVIFFLGPWFHIFFNKTQYLFYCIRYSF